MMKNNGKMSLMVLFFSHMAKQILAVLQLDFVENFFDVIDQKSDEMDESNN